MVQDQQVLSEVPNRAVLLSVFSAIQFKNNQYARAECFLRKHRIFVAKHVMRVYVLKCFLKYIHICRSTFRNAFRNVSLGTTRHANTRKSIARRNCNSSVMQIPTPNLLIKLSLGPIRISLKRCAPPFRRCFDLFSTHR